MANPSFASSLLPVALGQQLDAQGFDTLVAASAAIIPASTAWLSVAGYSTAGDGGAATYKSAPAGAGYGKFQSADGAWWIYVEGPNGVNVKAFGAKGDGATDDSAAINNAYLYLIGKGGKVYFPSSATAYVFQNLALSLVNNVTFEGETRATNAVGGVKLQLTTTTSNGFQMSTVSGIWFKNLMFTSPSALSPPTQTSGYYIQFASCNYGGVIDCEMTGAWDGIQITGTSTGIFVDRFFCRNFGHDGAFVNAPTGGGIYFDHVQMDQDNSTFTPNAGFELNAISDLRITNTDIIHCHQNLLINPSSSGFVEWCTFLNVNFDVSDFSINVNGRGILIAPTNTASVSGLFFSNIWTATAYHGIEIRGTAATSIRQIHIDGWYALNNYRNGMLATYCYGLTILRPHVLSNSTQTNGTYPGVEFTTGMDAIYIAGGTIGGSQAGFAGLHSYNVQTDAGFAGGTMRMEGVDVSGGFNTGIFLFTGALGSGSEISMCKGWNPLGPGAISVTASPFTYTAGSTKESIAISGGTVSAVVIGGITFFAASGCTVNLNPLQSVVVTYSGLPTMIANRA